MPEEMKQERCPNYNHFRENAPVRHCPNCGGLVNHRISPGSCGEAGHAESRRAQRKFCLDCGEQLIK